MHVIGYTARSWLRKRGRPPSTCFTAKTNVTEFANALEVDAETLSAEMISQLLSEQKKLVKALEHKASDLEKVKEQRDICKAEISRFDEKLKKLNLVNT